MIIDKIILFVIEAKLIIPANIGVEHGVPPSAKTAPNNIGYKYFELLGFDGILFIIVGRLISSIPIKFKPIAKITDAIMIIKYPPASDMNTCPVKAQITPIILNTIDEPIMNDSSCKKVFKLSLSPYPPIYPITIGNIASEHGEIDANKPPKNDRPISINWKFPCVACVVK